MKKVYNKWLDKTAEYTELKYKTHYKKKKTIERKIISYLNRSIPYFLTTNALEGKTIKWIAKGKNFTHEGMDERIFEDDEELFINSYGWVIKYGKYLYFKNKRMINIKDMIPHLWAIKKRK